MLIFACGLLLAAPVDGAGAAGATLGATALPTPNAWLSHHVELGERFFAGGDYRRATEEWERAAVMSEPQPGPTLSLRLAEGYYYGREFAAAERVLQTRLGEVLRRPCASDQLCEKARLLQIKGLLQMESYALARAALEDMSVQLGGQDSVQTRQLRGTVGYLTAFTWLLEGQTAKAQTTFAETAALPSHRFTPQAGELAASLKTAEPYRYSVPLATTLSIVPGLGQLYTSNYGQALAAFVLNAATGYLTYDAWQKSQQIPHYSRASSAVWGGLFAVAFTANLYNAGQLAREGNAARARALQVGAMRSGYASFLEE